MTRSVHDLAAIAPLFTRTTPTGNVYATLLQHPWAESIVRDFRWREYMRAQPDLDFASAEHALAHYIHHGYAEGRLFDPDRCRYLDPEYYRRRYPELNLPSDARARLHYCNVGYYEKRFANADTERIYNADLHVYQMGKVGSHAIAAGLQGLFPGLVMHMHWVTDMALSYPACSLDYSHILAHSRDRPVRVISAGREVVSRVVSGAFQYLDTLRKGEGELDIERVLAHLGGTFLHDCDAIVRWFDHKFHCGLDIYAHPFDHDRGYVRIGNETIDLFLYRQEDMARLERPIGDFVGLPDFRLDRSNTAEGKAYNDAYRALMERLVVPLPVLESLYTTSYMRYFYSDAERSRLIDYWSSPR